MKRFSVLVAGTAVVCGVMLWSGCSNESFLSDDGCTECTKDKFVSLKISTPSPDGIVLPKSRTTAIHEEQEWTLKSLNMYLFEKQDGSYTLFKEPIAYTFADGEQTDPGVGTDAGNGTYSLNLKIEDEMVGKTFKFVLVANDSPSAQVGTKLDVFKQSLATAVLQDNESADVIVGNPSSTDATGFPMTAIAKTTQTGGGTEDITIGYSDVQIEADLLRNVARIDFFNYTPNMVITGAKLTNTASKSYLFKQDGDTQAPESSTYVTMNPTSPWQTEFIDGVAYVTPDEPGDVSASKAKNTLKHVFYMYEQVNTYSTYSAVEISYTLTDLTGGGELKKKITVPLQKKAEPVSYINPTRNYLYTITLGNGTKVDNEIKVARVVVDDWAPGGEITEPINPDEQPAP